MIDLITKEQFDKIIEKEEYIEIKIDNINNFIYLIELNNFNIKSFKFYLKKEDIIQLII